jgi:5'-phosphate synthase pdxT subunit
MKVGVLALQGAITPHIQKITALGHEAIRVTNQELLQKCDALILPGGESSTMLKLIDSNKLFEPLKIFFETKPVWGTCAGAILLASEVTHPVQKCFAAIDIKAERNAYGSQLDSFSTDIMFPPLNKNISVDFIRAPKITPLNSDVEVISELSGYPICCKQKNILVTTFHTELGASDDFHRWLINSYFQSF